MTRWVKKAQEEIYRYHEFRRSDGKGWLAYNETITGATVTAVVKSTGDDVSAQMISNIAPYGQTKARYKLKGGDAGTLYLLTITVTTSYGQVLIDEIEVKVT